MMILGACIYRAIIDVRWCYCECYKCTTKTQSAGGYCGLAWLLFMCPAGDETSEKIETRPNEEARCWQGAGEVASAQTTILRSALTSFTQHSSDQCFLFFPKYIDTVSWKCCGWFCTKCCKNIILLEKYYNLPFTDGAVDSQGNCNGWVVSGGAVSAVLQLPSPEICSI